VGEIYHGLGVSAGIAAGRALLLESGPDSADSTGEEPTEPAGELARLHRARDEAKAELEEIRDRVRRVLGEHFSAILEVQLLLLDDPALMAATEDRILRARVTAIAALANTVRSLKSRLESVQQGYMREHGGDLDDVHRRLERHLNGRRNLRPNAITGPYVLVARSLGPAETVAMVREGVVALITDLGGPTSHTAILAKALSIPAVVGLYDVSRRVRAGESMVVNGASGVVELSPAPETLQRAAEQREAWLRAESAWAPPVPEGLATHDGVPVFLRANIELPEQVESAMRHGAHGVGLYRSEFLFITSAPRIPGEEQHYEAYRRMGEAVHPQPAVIRTLDLGGDKRFRDAFGEPGQDPGLRAIRLCLRRPDIFLPQLRGLLRAAVHGDVRVLIPMVTSKEEVFEVRRLLAHEAESLKAGGVACRADVLVGAMVEVPAAAATADLLVEACDFLSIGTNDLIQYALAVDRGSGAAAAYYEPLHPAVLRMVEFTARSGREGGRPVSLCGEMAANPAFTGLLLGLGIREFSVEPRALAAVAGVVRTTSVRRAEEFARVILTQADADSIARMLAVETGDGTSAKAAT